MYSLKSFQCKFAVTNHRANDLPKTRTSEKEQREWPLKDYEPEAMTCVYHTEDQQNLQELQSGESGTNALNFDHIFQLSWESDQKGELLKRNRPQMESLVLRPYVSKPRGNTELLVTTSSSNVAFHQSTWN